MCSVEQKCAQPGDLIEITDESLSRFGDQFVVVPRPVDFSEEEANDGDRAWISGWYGDDDDIFYIRSKHYKIVSRGKSSSRETKSVDDFLQRQRDDNLKSVFC